jgi:hypothetical protein
VIRQTITPPPGSVVRDNLFVATLTELRRTVAADFGTPALLKRFPTSNERRTVMKKIALGIVAAATIFTAVPAMAQVGFYAGPGGIGIGVGPPAPAYDYYGPGYYDYYGGPGVVVTPGWHDYSYHHYHHW